MKITPIAASLVCIVALAGCGKKNKEPSAPVEPTVAVAPAPAPVAPTPTPTPAPAPAPAPTTTSAPAPDTPEAQEQAEKLAKLDFATMEETYLKDSHGQWASSATATSTYGDSNGRTPSEDNAVSNLVGAPDSKSWTNNHQDMGFDSIELAYAKPVAATEVRVVSSDREAVESITKIELQAVDGSWSTVWSGVSDVKRDRRGSRTWFAKSFPKTAAPVKAVKVTFANNVSSGYKVVDAVQLVGDPM